jgi:putative peptidoglycan lipid II flippase
VRQRFFVQYLGASDAADAFNAAFKIPNFLQNLFGEGALSGSLIPVYSRLLAENKEEEAKKLAWHFGLLLFSLTTLMSALGMIFAPSLISLVAPGFEGAKAQLTTQLVRIFFPSCSALVLSAWCLGILNSHRKFFLSYFAPVLWNLTIISGILYFARYGDQEDLVIKVAIFLLLGSILQFGVQLPVVLSLCKPTLDLKSFKTPALLQAIRNFLPILSARGVVQVSGYVDQVIASFALWNVD